MFFISLDKLIEILAPLLVVVCIVVYVGIDKDYDAIKEQERQQALEEYQVESVYIDKAEILQRYLAQGDRQFVQADKFTFYKHDDEKNIDIYERRNIVYSNYERVTVNSETQEIKSYWIVYNDLIPDGDITKKVVHDYSDFIKGRFDENASWSKTSGEKKYNASGILTYISSRTDGKVEMYHSNFHKNGADFDCLISSQPDSVAISLYYEF